MTTATTAENNHVLPDIAISSVKEADDVMTRDLLRLSFEDRNAIDEEIHGVSNAFPAETMELMQTALHNLSAELLQIPNKPAFDKSQLLFPNDTYVNTLDFRLRFLRCELFDARKAAIRMVTFLDLLDELGFGNEVLRRPIQFSDLSKEDVKLFRVGFVQMLPFRDRSGRPILAGVGTIGFQYDLIQRMRIHLYITFVFSNDVESQRKGMVNVLWPEGDFSEIQMPLHNDSRNLLKKVIAAAPLRLVAVHICFPDTLYFNLLRSFLILTFSSQRSRMKFHVGTSIERRYSLQGFGIPVEILPITHSGNVKRTCLYRWIRVRQFLESGQKLIGTSNIRSDDSIILLPRSNDVLFRTGTTATAHPGNAHFRSLIELKYEEVILGCELTQAILAEEIVREIERMNGRFLKWDNRGH